MHAWTHTYTMKTNEKLGGEKSEDGEEKFIL